MRHLLRVFIVGLMVTVMAVPPAVAWHCCGSYEPVYHDGCCGEVVVDDGCDGCGSCDGCNGCSDCDGCDGATSDTATEAEPLPPAESDSAPTAPQDEPPAIEEPYEAPPAPVETTMPVEEPAEESDSLFNGTEEATPPPAEEPAMPVEEPAAPAEEPAADLFGEPAETTPPAETPVEETPAETPPADAPAEEPAEEPADLFGEPAETETETPAEETPAEEPAEETPAEEQPAEESDDDIFGATRNTLGEPGGLASTNMRTWVDNTGSYSCRGRLISLQDSHVRLLKDNGRTTTVPLSRLSTNDLKFVHRQASAQQGEGAPASQRLAAVTNSAN